jgi:hypothetical protein
VKSLQKHRDYPSISILAPTHRSVPANKQDPIKVKNLVRKAIDRVQKEMSKRDAAPLVKQLQELVKQIDFKHTLDGLALFASRDVAKVVTLPFKVKPRAIIDETFATRDLVYAYNRARPYRVLALSHAVRLFDAWTTVLEEHHTGGFPMEYRAGADKKLSRRQVMTRSDAREDDHRKFFLEVDAALGAIHKADPRPIIVTGVERNLAFFREVTKHADAIYGMLAGNHDQTSPSALGKLVWPVYEVGFTRERAEALVKLDEAVSAQKHTSGIDQVWRAAVRGQCRMLFVEKDFKYPAQLSDDGDLLLAPTGKGAANLDDAVDEIIEKVLEAGGEVFFYPEGDLDVHQRIAAVLRS